MSWFDTASFLLGALVQSAGTVVGVVLLDRYRNRRRVAARHSADEDRIADWWP